MKNPTVSLVDSIIFIYRKNTDFYKRYLPIFTSYTSTIHAATSAVHL